MSEPTQKADGLYTTGEVAQICGVLFREWRSSPWKP